jgi:RNA polymerase sigma-70 factor (ECF subfamily)
MQANEALTNWVMMARAGDRRAFAQVVESVREVALAFCYGRLGSRELARDAAQEAFVDAYLHLAQLEDAAAFGAWFRRVLIKHCERRYRRKQPDPAALAQERVLAPAIGDAEAGLLARERETLVRNEVEALPEHERMVVALYYLADVRVSEIADLLELTETAVKQRLHSARKRLRERSEKMLCKQLSTLEVSNGPAFSDGLALFTAIRSGDEHAVATLLKSRPELCEMQEQWDVGTWPERDLPVPAASTPLIRAAEFGQVSIVRRLLEAGASVDGSCGCFTHETALWAAVVNDQPGAAAELLARGADPRRASQRGVTPLHAAAMRGRAELADLLLAHGADPTQRDADGRTPGDWAALNGHH